MFTSLLENTDDRPGEHALSQVYTPPFCLSVEAITTEMESHQNDMVELTSPSTSSPRHPTVVNLSEGRSEQTSYTKPSQLISPIGSPRKVQFRPEVYMSEFHPSGLPSQPVEATTTPIVFDPDWLNTPSIISAIKLLGRTMTLDEFRRWTVNRAANRDASQISYWRLSMPHKKNQTLDKHFPSVIFSVKFFFLPLALNLVPL